MTLTESIGNVKQMATPADAIGFAQLLIELARRIGPIVMRHVREETSAERRETFQRNVIAYHDRVRRILYNDDGSPKRLAEDISKDRIFCYYATDEESRLMIDALFHVTELSKARKSEKREILQALLKVLENARVPREAFQMNSDD